MLTGLMKKIASTTMGSCASNPSRKSSGQKRRKQKSGKRRGNGLPSALPELPLKRVSNAGSRVGDFSLSNFVHLDFENNGASAPSCRRSEVSNMKFHLTQYHSHSQIDANGMFSLLPSSLLQYKTIGRFLLINDCLKVRIIMTSELIISCIHFGFFGYL